MPEYYAADLTHIIVRDGDGHEYELTLPFAIAVDLAAFCTITGLTPQQVLQHALEAYLQEAEGQ